MHKVTFIPGDGIGPEVSEATKRCIEATGVKISWDVLSAGVFAYDGAPPTPEAVAAAGSLGAPVESHRSRKLTDELIRSADLLFCMTARHVAAVMHMAGGAAERTLALDPDGDIVDPIGGGESVYVRVAGRIEKCLRRRMKENLL